MQYRDAPRTFDCLHIQCPDQVDILLFPPISKAPKQSTCDGHCDPASDDDGNNKSSLAGDVDGRGREVDGVDVRERARVSDRKRFHLALTGNGVLPPHSLVKAGLASRLGKLRTPSGEGATRVAACTSEREHHPTTATPELPPSPSATTHNTLHTPPTNPKASKMGDPRQMWENMQKTLQRAQRQGPKYAYTRGKRIR